jgi:hypothetical protein
MPLEDSRMSWSDRRRAPAGPAFATFTMRPTSGPPPVERLADRWRWRRPAPWRGVRAAATSCWSSDVQRDAVAWCRNAVVPLPARLAGAGLFRRGNRRAPARSGARTRPWVNPSAHRVGPADFRLSPSLRSPGGGCRRGIEQLGSRASSQGLAWPGRVEVVHRERGDERVVLAPPANARPWACTASARAAARPAGNSYQRRPRRTRNGASGDLGPRTAPPDCECSSV